MGKLKLKSSKSHRRAFSPEAFRKNRDAILLAAAGSVRTAYRKTRRFRLDGWMLAVMGLITGPVLILLMIGVAVIVGCK